MPQLYVLSDLHCEFAPFSIEPASDIDVVVLAGDIDRGTKGIDWARSTFPNLPIVYVAGNHEFYGGAIPKLTERLRERARVREVAFLENDMAEISGVRFVGCTLWTNLELVGAEPWRLSEIQRVMTDYRAIRVSPRYRRLQPQDTAVWHARSIRWLETALEPSRTTVVVTHHAPSRRSVSPDSLDDPISAAYASDLDDFVSERAPALWVHGHTHHNVDYRIGETRVLTNQRGYPDDAVPGFDKDLIVTVGD